MSMIAGEREVAPRRCAGAAGLQRAGAYAAAAMIALIPLQMLVFVMDPPPDTAEGWLALFDVSALRGLLAMDGLYVLNNVLLGVLLLGLYSACAARAPQLSLAGLVVGVTSIGVYFSTNKGLELWQLSSEYSAADAAGRAGILAAARAQMVEYTGTAFAVYYILGGISIVFFAGALARTRMWGRLAWVSALASGLLMLVPSTAGTVGMVFSVLSLIPWMLFCLIAVRRLWRAAISPIAS